MIHSIVKIVTSPTTLALAKKLGSVWLFSFVAASGGIVARHWHRDVGPNRPAPTRQRPYGGLNVWRRKP